MQQSEAVALGLLAFIAPIPVLHLWLHALLPFWRKYPLGIYMVGAVLWIMSFFLFASLVLHQAFDPIPTIRTMGNICALLGLAGIATSFFTLGPRRFLAYEALRPSERSQERETRGVFGFIPHPAYLGYLFVSLGLIFITGYAEVIMVFIYLLIITPIVIWLEEQEMRERFSKLG